MTPFDRAEYERRIARTQERMEAEGLDALLVTDPANMNYLSGYDGWSFYVHQLVILGRDADRPVWIGREHDVNGARATTWIDDEDIRAYADDYVQSPADEHPMDVAADVVADLGYADRTLGVEMDAYYYTARSHQRLRENLPAATFEDATLLVNWIRTTKSERELEYMREAARISENAMQAGLDAIEPGIPEYEVAAAIYAELVGGTDGYGGDYPAIVPLLPSGEHTGSPHLTWSDRRLERGDPVLLELSGCRHRYHSPLTRTAYVGTPPDRIRRTTDVVARGIEAALDAAEPGVTCEAVERAWRDVVSRHGIEKESRIGYSVGLGYPPDWGEHTASIRPRDETVLEEGMTFHLIPGLWKDDYAVAVSETFHVTENGTEILTNLPRTLFVR